MKRLMPAVSRRVEPPKRYVPPFQNGDRMDRSTFHTLYEQTPKGFKAELIGGIVYMASPVSLRKHSRQHVNMVHWLATYSDETDGTEVLDNTTAALGDDSEPQPDTGLLISPEVGGQTTLVNDIIHGAPEMVVEVANSSMAIDLHAKKRDYDVNGVREYIVVVVPTTTVHYFVRGKAGFKEMKPDAAGVLKSKVFPGLWLDTAGVFDRTARRLLATLRTGLASPEHAKFAAKLAKKLG